MVFSKTIADSILLLLLLLLLEPTTLLTMRLRFPLRKPGKDALNKNTIGGVYIFQPRYSPFPFLLSNLVIDALPALIRIIHAMKPFHHIPTILLLLLSSRWRRKCQLTKDGGEKTIGCIDREEGNGDMPDLPR